MITTYVQSVEQREKGWRIRFSADERFYMTRNAFKASICQRAMERKKLVQVWGGGGWYYKQLDTVREVADAAVQA
jgi:hypothetical protein